MKKLSFLQFPFFLLLLLSVFVACKKEVIYPLAESITLDESSIEVREGDNKYIYYTILPEEVGDTATVYFSSADESIATVSEWGSVTGVKEGHTTVTATVHGKSATLEVDVLKAVITKFTLTYNGQPLPEVLDVPYGDNSISIDITDVKPSNVDLDGMTVSSKDKSIAEAKRDGKQVVITPKGEGETTIVVRGGDVKKEININVKMIHAEKVVIDQKNPEVGLNTTLELTATTTPVDVSLPQRTWSSSNPSVVAVDAETGVVTGKGEGSATITVTVDGKSASTVVKVLYIKPQTVAINPTSKTLVLNDTYQLEAITTPAEVTYPEVTWSSSNSSVASVDENGLVTAKGLGSATISAKVDGVVGTSTITVSEFPPITGFDLSASATQVEITKSITLSIKNLEPSGASYGDIKWSIDNTSLASISVNKNTGVCTLTAKDQEGYVTVTAESNGVVKTQKIQITKIAVKSISVSSNVEQISGYYCFWAPTSATDYAETAYGSGKDIEFTVSVSPANASLANHVTFTSDNSNVQVKKVGNVYKLYVSSSAKGKYTLNASCDGVNSNLKVHVIPNSYTPVIPAIYGNPATMKSSYGVTQWLEDLYGLDIKALVTEFKGTVKSQTYTTLTIDESNEYIIYDCKDVAYSTNLNVDKVEVSYKLLGRPFTHTVSFYNTYFGLSAYTYQGSVTTNTDTNYQYYIQEGKKTANCELIGYDTPKFRFKSSTKVPSTEFRYYIYIHYYDPTLTAEKIGDCAASTRSQVLFDKTTLDESTKTGTLPNSNIQYKIDYYD